MAASQQQKTHRLAGQAAPPSMLVDVGALKSQYYSRRPDPDDPLQLVNFGTSGHRGTPLDGTFTESHILAITQAICDYRKTSDIGGPLFLGKDTHGVSGPAQQTALEVLAANDVEVVIERSNGYTPTPAISRAILAYNRARRRPTSDGIVVTPSHNPPEDGGFKYNPPHGGPADAKVTGWIQQRANALLRAGVDRIRRVTIENALRAPTTHADDLMLPYVRDLASVIDMSAICRAHLSLGVDPLGGAACSYWEPIAQIYGLELTVVDSRIDPQFGFMTVDHDGKIRTDCSSPYAMARLVGVRDRFRVAWGNDADADRHGIVTPGAGLLNPNHFIAIAVRYLLTHRPAWPTSAAIGKTLVSSDVIDRVVQGLRRRVFEVPVGFKWFVPGLTDASCCFCGEESAGATFLRRDGTTWTTDKDGLIMGLLAAEMTAVTGRDPSEHLRDLTGEFGATHYTRVDAPLEPALKQRLANIDAAAVKASTLAGEPIVAKLTRAPGNQEPIGGIKVASAHGWFAIRPSGTESTYKIYAESFTGQSHLDAIVEEAQRILADALTADPKAPRDHAAIG